MRYRTLWLVVVAAVCLFCLGLAPSAEKQQEIDWKRAQQIHQRFVRGEKLSEEERAYHERAIKAFRAKAEAEKRKAKPAKPPVGLKPLTDMTAKDHYKGQDGGLYGGGKNDPPEKHLQAALRQAKLIQPLDAQGNPADDGKIVFISVGMSNTTQEFSVFEGLANDDSAKSPKVVIVDGAQGGVTTSRWVAAADAGAKQTTIADGAPSKGVAANNPWSVLDQRLHKAGVTAQQVQAAWIKEAEAGPANLGEFPKHAEALKGYMVTLLNKLQAKFPNLRLAYLSSRIYAGYATTALNPEPYAYESAFAVRWLIQDQVKGIAKLNFDPEKGEVKSPLLLWGPYLWADGEKGRKAGDLVWKPDDLGPDGTHPSPSGRRKVAGLLLHFVKSDPTAKVWFVQRSTK